MLRLTCILIYAMLAAPAFPQSPAQGWKLVWSDEFNGTGLPDASKWGYEVGYVRNKEAQYFTQARRENARQENGNLVIEARRDGFQGHTYTSASLVTRGKASWTYGRMEIRAILPRGKGTWPAIWTMGTTGAWPACGEIDILESWGKTPDWIQFNIHTTAFNWMTKKSPAAKSVFVADLYTKFHTFAIEWHRDRIDFFVDDRKLNTFANMRTGPDAWPFDRPQYLILNLALGGAMGGPIDDAIFPARFLIDYVRVYAWDANTTGLGRKPSPAGTASGGEGGAGSFDALGRREDTKAIVPRLPLFHTQTAER